jgi:hypothetical protein
MGAALMLVGGCNGGKRSAASDVEPSDPCGKKVPGASGPLSDGLSVRISQASPEVAIGGSTNLDVSISADHDYRGVHSGPAMSFIADDSGSIVGGTIGGPAIGYRANLTTSQPWIRREFLEAKGCGGNTLVPGRYKLTVAYLDVGQDGTSGTSTIVSEEVQLLVTPGKDSPQPEPATSSPGDAQPSSTDSPPGPG